MTSTDHPTAGGLVVPHPDVHDDAEPAPDAVALVPVQVHYPTLASQQAHRISDAKATHRLQHRVQARLASSQLGHPTPTQLVCLHETLTDRIHRQVGQGATVHQRLPRLLRAIPPVVALLDLVVLFSFCADIFDVPLDHPWTARAPMALMLALLASGVAYAWFSLTGRALRGYRTPMGEVEWGTTGPTTRVMLAVSLIVTSALSLLMYTRVLSEAIASGRVGAAAQVLGVVFAVLSAAANLAVVAVHALDGSEDAAQVRRTGRLLRRRDRLTARAERAVAVRNGDHG